MVRHMGVTLSHLDLSCLVFDEQCEITHVLAFGVHNAAVLGFRVQMQSFLLFPFLLGGKRNSFSTCKAKAAASGPLLEMEAC